MFSFLKKRTYLDWAAATPMRKEVFLAMRPFLFNNWGNPSAIHQEGQVARQAVENAREEVAKSLQVRPEFVTFLSGGTEANNLAMVGLVEALHKKGREFSDMELITTAIEHPSISKTGQYLSGLGVSVKEVKVNDSGEVNLSQLRDMMSSKTILVSVAYVNSEIGVIQPLHSIRKILKEAEEKYQTDIFLHVDAAQAPLWLSCQFDKVGADLLTLDTGKCCGPKGVGVLVQSRRVELRPTLFGGGQEKGLRAGTENVSAVVGAATALKWAQSDWRQHSESVAKVRDAGIDLLLKEIPIAVLNGPKGEKRVANNINVSIPGLDTEYATVYLDKHGFAVSTKSACAGAGGGESAVVKAISGDHLRASSTLRISIGPDTTVSDLKRLTATLKNHCEMMGSVE